MASPPPPLPSPPPPLQDSVTPPGGMSLAKYPPPPPPPAYFTSPDQFQAAKYFTFIFFGLSVFVILLFGGFVICHCYRRLRYDSQRNREHNLQIAHLAATGAAQPRPNRDVIIMVPVKEGYVVQNPDGGTDVAFIPDAPQRAKSQPAAPSAGASSTPGSSQAAFSPAPLPAAASLPASPQGTRGSEADDARQSTELQRPSDVRWLRSVSSMPSSPVAASSARSGDAVVPQRSADRLDQYWRQRQAQVYQIF